eukprot:COSAG04_NODE_7863_length_1055_cov_1.338912_3_plen_83_part_01
MIDCATYSGQFLCQPTPTIRPFLAHFPPFSPRIFPVLRRPLRLAPKTPETGTKNRKKDPENVRKFFLSYRNGDNDEDEDANAS